MRYQFDQFSLDSDRLEIRRGNEVLRSEPRVLELLAYLIQHRQELIPRDRLVDDVWQGQAVSDSALTRCIYQLRRLLGESAQEPRYVQTVHGRGVRFSNTIEVVEVQASLETRPPRSSGEVRPSSFDQPGKESQQSSGNESARQGKLAGGSPPVAEAVNGIHSSAAAPSTDSTDSATPQPEAPSRLTKLPLLGRIPLFAGLFLISLLLVAVLFILQRRDGGPKSDSAGTTNRASTGEATSPPQHSSAMPHRTSETATPRPRLAILPLSSGEEAGSDIDRPTTAAASAANELRTASLSLADLVHQRLSTVPGLELRPLALTETNANSADSLREVAERAGANLLLAGTIQANQNGRHRVRIDLWEMSETRGARQTVLGNYDLPSLEANFSEFLRIRDAIAQRTAELVGMAFVFSEKPPGSTESPEAYRLFILAYQKLIDDFCGGAEPAIGLLERALEIDPEFGLAWAGIGVANYNLVWACGEHAELLDQAMFAVDRALELAPEMRSPRFERITLLMETGRLEEAYEQVLEEIENHPNEALSLNAKAYALRRAGFLKPSAAALDRLLEVDPLIFSVGSLGGSPNTYLYQGKWDRFLAAAPLSEMAYHRFYRGLAEVLRNREGAARASLEPAIRSSPNQIFGRMSAALIEILDGKPLEAQAILDEIARQRQATEAPDGEMAYKLAQLYALAGDSGPAIRSLEEGLELGFFCLPCLNADPLLDSLRQNPRWRPLVEQARTRHLAFARRFGLEPELGG